jgi:methylenetetrahydrofolate dehydrogenase (NAD+)
MTMASHATPKTCKVITAETIAKKLLLEVKETLDKIQETGTGAPSLVAFLANDDPAAVKYAEWSKKSCEEK